MQNAYIIDAVRTHIGSYGGSLSAVRPDDLAAIVIKALLQRNPQVSPQSIEEVIFGAANQAGEDNRNVARMAALLAGLPVTCAGVTVNRLCASGLQAIADATRCLQLGEGNIYIAGGVESMSRAPFVMPKSPTAFHRTPEIFDTTIGWRFTNPTLAALYHPYSMGETAENVAQKWQISRQDQDNFAFDSQQKYQKAHEQALFSNEIVPVEVRINKKETRIVDKDEHPRQTNREKLTQLPSAFVKDGSVTAGNSSGINDGAAALLLANESTVVEQAWQPLLRVVAIGIAGVEPAYMGIGPVPAIQKALQRAQLRIEDIDLFELNEAFAAQVLASVQQLHIPLEKVNVRGGAIALGHPLGCSGARITTTLAYAMRDQRARYGVAAMCVGVGQGVAIVYERV